MSTYVCPSKDIECGDRPEHWCDSCPKKAQSFQDRDSLIAALGQLGRRNQELSAQLASRSPRRLERQITLTGLQLKRALYWAVPDGDPDHLEAEVSIGWSDGIESADEEMAVAPGYVLWWSDYPEEGCVPLDEQPPGTSAAPSPSTARPDALSSGGSMRSSSRRPIET